ncbi:MAG: hypothetical protein Phog2KO_06770 [Phototrophicaceae bacterium]
MIDNLRAYFRPKVPYDDPLTQQLATGLLIYLGVALIIIIFSAIYLAILIIREGDGNFSPDIAEVVGILAPFFTIGWIWAIRNGFYRISAITILIVVILPLFSYWNTSLNTIEVLIFFIPIVTANVLLGHRWSIFTYILTIILTMGPTIFAPEPNYTDFINFVLIFSVITILLTILSSSVQDNARRSIVELGKTQAIIRATVETSQELDETRAMIGTINIIRDQLGYTFARIYLVEDGEVIQRIQTGLNLSQMNTNADVSFSKRSAIYDAIRKKEVVAISMNDDEIVRQHLLSGTQGALVVPMMNNQGNIIAILDIQSEDRVNFSPSEIQTIQLLAQQSAQTIQHLRLITNLSEDLTEQDLLIERQREQLLHYEKTERQTTTDAWRKYLEERGSDFVGYDMESGATSPIEAIEMDEDLESAIQTGTISIQEDGDQQIVSIPINLRGQSLGAMSFRVPAGSQVVGARQQELIRNVVQRLSLALENKRLFEQSQSQASRERKANEIGNLLLSSTDIDTVLNLAAINFNDALGAIQTQIRIKPEIANIGENETNL